MRIPVVAVASALALLVSCEDGSLAPLPPGTSKGGASGAGGHDSATTGAGATGSTGAGTDTDFECGEVELPIKVEKPNVVLVLDRSGSMAEPWDHDANPVTPDVTRWDSLGQAAAALVDSFDQAMRLGALAFPHPRPRNDCGVAPDPHVPIADGGGADVEALIAHPDSFPAGGTPTSIALGVGAAALAARPPGEPRVMVLVSDGVPTCGDSFFAAISAATKARTDHGVFTFAVGVDVDPAAVASFQALAAAGGTGEVFFNGANEQELTDALETVAVDVIRCRIPLAVTPDEPDDLEVTLDGAPVPRVDACAAGPGWAFVNPAGPLDTIEICASTCDALNEQSDLVAIFACPPSTPGP